MINNRLGIIIWLIFECIAIFLWKTQENMFYLLNFSYIGTVLALGVILFENKYRYARHATQVFIGTYMLVYLGFILRENMQITGFWYYLFLGVFEAAVIHYMVAKILGPFIFGRGWCGYACWTAMILDLLPYKIVKNQRAKYEYIRYIMFVIALAFVTVLFILQVKNIENIMYITFIWGNIVYYIIGIILAYKFKDNRAFCKYVCPVTVFLKPASYFSIVRIKFNESKCINCKKCKQICPMNVDMMDNSRKRKYGTECILCGECVKCCPTKALK